MWKKDKATQGDRERLAQMNRTSGGGIFSNLILVLLSVSRFCAFIRLCARPGTIPDRPCVRIECSYSYTQKDAATTTVRTHTHLLSHQCHIGRNAVFPCLRVLCCVLCVRHQFSLSLSQQQQLHACSQFTRSIPDRKGPDTGGRRPKCVGAKAALLLYVVASIAAAFSIGGNPFPVLSSLSL